MQAPVAGNIYGILEGSKQYVIPVYQRIYSWEQSHCERLWSDVVEMHRSSKPSHFIGTIVNVAEKTAPVGIQEYSIIDGQQRLTTLSILLLALRDYAKKHANCGVNPEKITKNLLINEFETGNDKYKILLTQSDREVLKKKIEGVPIPESLKSRVIDNYDFFTGKIEKGEITPPDLYVAIGRLQLVNITLDRNHDDPQAIFESLNSTGMDLLGSDLIRNYILMALPPASQESLYNNVWRPMEELFSYGNQATLMDNFFRDYLTMKLGRLVNQRDVYREFKAYKSTNWTLQAEELCHDLLAFAKHYVDMDSGNSNDPELKSLYNDLKNIGISVAYPFLLKVHEDYANNIITVDMLREIVAICVNFALRRSVCGMRTTGLNYMFAVLKNSINPADYMNSIKAYFILQETSKEFPRDKRFADEFVIQDIYSKKICRFILCKLETWNGHKIVSLDDLSVEHVFPQKPKPSEWGVLQKELLHTIGNLTLAHWADNSSLSNKPFTKKLTLTQGYKQSALRLNEYIVEQSTWGEIQITERSKRLAELAMKVWPYPQLTDEELKPYQPEPEPGRRLENYKYFNASTKTLFEILDGKIKNLGTTITRVFNNDYVAYKVDTNFADVEIQKTRLHIWVNMRFGEVADPRGLCRDVSGVGHLGNGDVELYYDFNTSVDDVMAIIEQAFRLQGVE